MILIPGIHYLFIGIAGALSATLGLMHLHEPQAQPTAPIPTWLNRSSRWTIGQLSGLILAGAIGTGIIINGVQGNERWLLIGLAVTGYLGLGIVLPRRPQVRQQREAAHLRRLTPGFIGFVRIGLSSMEPPFEIMQRYCARPQPQQSALQTLVGEAIELSRTERLRPFTALSRVAHQRACRELSDICDALAQAEADGHRMEGVLEAQQHSLEHILQSEFKRMVQRKTVYLLLMVAISLTVGILLNLLFVMTNGGSLLVEIT
jgi:hypothetical protein